MTITGLSAHADQLHAELRESRDCDALDPCVSCSAKGQVVRVVRRVARVAVATGVELPRLPTPRASTMLSQRLSQIAL